MVGVIATTHGVRGQVKIRSFTADPEDIITYGTLWDKTGKRSFNITIASQTKDTLIASVEGVTSKEQAETLRGMELYIPSSALPAPAEGEFYQRDLIGMDVRQENDEAFGTVKAFHNFGAGELVEIALPDGEKTEMLHFTKAVFPKIDAKNKVIIIHPPEYIAADEDSKE